MRYHYSRLQLEPRSGRLERRRHSPSPIQRPQMDFLELAQRLVSIESVTSQPNAAVADFLYAQLTRLGFDIESLAYKDNAGLEKVALVARRGPQPNPTQQQGGGVVFCCHNDVVSVDGWNAKQGGPFDAVVADGRLWGRGACDMKGPIAAALAAAERIPISAQRAPIYFLITGDEESGMQGANTVVAHSKFFAELKSAGTVGIIGEPTQLQVVNSHKGGCHLKIIAHGVAAHSSTADGINANWAMIPFLSYLRGVFERTQRDPQLLNRRFDPPTLSMNVILKNEPSAANITVGKSTCQVFFRPMRMSHGENWLTRSLKKPASWDCKSALSHRLNRCTLLRKSPLFKKSFACWGSQNRKACAMQRMAAACAISKTSSCLAPAVSSRRIDPMNGLPSNNSS